MRARGLAFVAVFSVSIALLSMAQADVKGQARASVMSGGLPRTADGHPDLQGTYDLGTLTPLERRADTPLVLTDEQAKELEIAVAKRTQSGNAPVDGNRAAPPKGGDGTATSAATTISGSTRDRPSRPSTAGSAPRS